MELAWAVGGIAVGALAMWWYCWPIVTHERKRVAFHKDGVESWKDLCRKSDVVRQEAVGLAELATSKYIAAQDENAALKRENSNLSRVWRIAAESDACKCHKLDDQVEWRIRNIEAQLRAQEGEL